MARLSFPSIPISRAYHLFWISLTYVTLFDVVWPAVRTVDRIRSQSDITDLERLACDISRLWYVPVLWLCVVLCVGCIVGFLSKHKVRTICNRIIVQQMFFLFICDTFTCYSTYELLQSGGFEIIGKACQADKLKEIPSQLEEFCRVTQIGAKYVALAALVVWKLVGLNMVVLTLAWYKWVAEEETRLKEEIKKEVREGAGPVKLTGEETLDVEQKV